MPPSKSYRIEEIDALRGIAAMFAFVGHYTVTYFHDDGIPNDLGFHLFIGGYGVYLFFVISGFVIPMTLHRCRTSLDFVVSRFSRIFPAYWGALLLTSGILYFFGSPYTPSLPRLLVGFTMLERLVGFQHVDPVYWTLNVELSFYLWMLLVFKLGGLDRLERIIPFVLAFQWGAEVYSRLVGHIFPQGINVVFLLEYAHMFCAGMLFYDAREKGFTPWKVLLLAWCFLNQGIVNYRVYDWTLSPVWGIPATFVVFLIMFFAVRGDLRWLSNKVLLFLGTISYTVYLLHNEIGRAIRLALGARGIAGWPGMLIAMAATVLLATALTFLVEKPAMVWIRRMYRGPKPAESVPAAPAKS